MKQGINEILKDQFREVGTLFLKKYQQGFSQRKPKKIMAHTRYVLRTYRQESSLDMFSKLSGIILTWRYAKISKIPEREFIKLERSILWSFNFILNKVISVQANEVTFLLAETAPARSIMHQDDPLRMMIELKLLEFQIQDSIGLSVQDDELESKWKKLYEELYEKFRFRIPAVG